MVTQSRWASEQRERLIGEDQSLNIEQRMAVLKRHGGFSLAYSTAVQPLLKYHGDDSGYLAYRQRWGITFVLGDPVAEPARQADLVKEFIGRFPKSAFCQISQSTAEILSGAGYRVNEFGVDTRLKLDEYTLDGKEKEWLRYAFNWINRRGYFVKEGDFHSIDIDEVEALSEAWRKTRTVKRKEVRFLNRPIVLEREPGVRRFFLFNNEGKMEAYVFFDPLYQEGKVFGYVTTFKRRHPDATQYAEQAIMKAAIQQFKAEGIAEIRLGLSPFAWIENEEFDRSWFASKLMRTMFRSRLINRYGYNLIGHAEYKRRFRGKEEKTYFATRSRVPVRAMAALIGLCGIV